MKKTIPIKQEFINPTMRQNHVDKTWDTIIGRKNLISTVEAVATGLCANPNIAILSHGQVDAKDLTDQIFAVVDEIYEELEYRRSNDDV